MTEPQTQSYLARGRLFGGLSIAMFATIALFMARGNHDLQAFGMVASIAGFVASAWGAAATLVSPNFPPNRLIAFGIFLLPYTVLGIAMCINGPAIEIFFPGYELLAVAIASAPALAIGTLAVWLVRNRNLPAHSNRSRLLLVFAISFVLIWPAVRWPMIALRTAGAIGKEEDLFGTDAIKACRFMPNGLMNWAVQLALQSPDPVRRRNAVNATYSGCFSPQELTKIILDDPDMIVAERALDVLYYSNRPAAAEVLMALLDHGRDGRAGEFMHSPVYSAALNNEQIVVAVKSKYVRELLFSAGQRNDAKTLLIAARVMSLARVVDFGFFGSYDHFAANLFRDLEPKGRLELFVLWFPDDRATRPTDLPKAYFDDGNTFWQQFRAGSTQLYMLALQSRDPTTRAAAYQNVCNNVTNPEKLRIAMGDDSSGEKMPSKQACDRLLNALILYEAELRREK